MPIYEYQCRKCGKPFEFEQRMSDPPKTKCPACKGKLKKLISLAGFQLKGSGWYKDGYASSKPGKPEIAPAQASAAASQASVKSEAPKTEKETSKKKKPMPST